MSLSADELPKAGLEICRAETVLRQNAKIAHKIKSFLICSHLAVIKLVDVYKLFVL
jgi:hypothetical protein